ncbi:MAG: hypothetical protein HRT89_05085, partial [Lentisphaeria bacterium]|nr:hypothetical protein [Lentisphaeria bacterium]NQZ67424.1 hypothetical protein [Lentisphaeria bacterium]
AISPLSLLVALYNLIFTRATPFWLALGGAFCFATYLYLYLLGCVVQNVDKKTGIRKTVLRTVQTAVLLPVSSALEGVAIISGLTKPTNKFEIIKK